MFGIAHTRHHECSWAQDESRNSESALPLQFQKSNKIMFMKLSSEKHSPDNSPFDISEQAFFSCLLSCFLPRCLESDSSKGICFVFLMSLTPLEKRSLRKHLLLFCAFSWNLFCSCMFLTAQKLFSFLFLESVEIYGNNKQTTSLCLNHGLCLAKLCCQWDKTYFLAKWIPNCTAKIVFNDRKTESEIWAFVFAAQDKVAKVFELLCLKPGLKKIKMNRHRFTTKNKSFSVPRREKNDAKVRNLHLVLSARAVDSLLQIYAHFSFTFYDWAISVAPNCTTIMHLFPITLSCNEEKWKNPPTHKTFLAPIDFCLKNDKVGFMMENSKAQFTQDA